MFAATQKKDVYKRQGYNSENLPTSLVKGIMTLAAPYAPLDGVNEKGLAVGVLQIKTTPTNQQTDKVDITTTSAIRLLLDRAATVEEAIELLSQYDMHASANSCYHFHIADANGGSVIVEYIDDEMSVVPVSYTHLDVYKRQAQGWSPVQTTSLPRWSSSRRARPGFRKPLPFNRK